ncbi:MAG: hypothetical protein CUN49_18810, partial [Candidatus Thermofonsia Clade 1 bacterium]
AAAQRSEEMERHLMTLTEQYQAALHERDRVVAMLTQLAQEIATIQDELARADHERGVDEQARAALAAELQAAQERALQAARAEATVVSQIEQLSTQQARL